MTCPTCKARLQKERVYLWDGCADCFLAAADSLSGREIAEMTGESVAYSKQMLAYANGAVETADLLRIEHRRGA